MNKSDFVALVAEKANLSKKDAEAAVNAYAEASDQRTSRRRKSTVSRVWYI